MLYVISHLDAVQIGLVDESGAPGGRLELDLDEVADLAICELEDLADHTLLVMGQGDALRDCWALDADTSELHRLNDLTHDHRHV